MQKAVSHLCSEEESKGVETWVVDGHELCQTASSDLLHDTDLQLVTFLKTINYNIFQSEDS